MGVFGGSLLAIRVFWWWGTSPVLLPIIIATAITCICEMVWGSDQFNNMMDYDTTELAIQHSKIPLEYESREHQKRYIYWYVYIPC